MRYFVFIVSVLFFCASSGGYASVEWEFVTEEDGITFFIDRESIIHNPANPNLVRIWELVEFDQAQGIRGATWASLSAKSLQEYDCAAASYRLLTETAYSGPLASGEAVDILKYPSEWRYISSGTKKEFFLSIVCP